MGGVAHSSPGRVLRLGGGAHSGPGRVEIGGRGS